MTISAEAIADHAAKNRVSLEIAKSQLEYAARPFLVLWRDSHCSIPSRFNTMDEAFNHVHWNWERIQRKVQRERYTASNLGYRGTNGSYIEGPGIGRLPLGWVLLASDVSSY